MVVSDSILVSMVSQPAGLMDFVKVLLTAIPISSNTNWHKHDSGIRVHRQALILYYYFAIQGSCTPRITHLVVTRRINFIVYTF